MTAAIPCTVSHVWFVSCGQRWRWTCCAFLTQASTEELFEKVECEFWAKPIPKTSHRNGSLMHTFYTMIIEIFTPFLHLIHIFLLLEYSAKKKNALQVDVTRLIRLRKHCCLETPLLNGMCRFLLQPITGTIFRTVKASTWNFHFVFVMTAIADKGIHLSLCRFLQCSSKNNLEPFPFRCIHLSSMWNFNRDGRL